MTEPNDRSFPVPHDMKFQSRNWAAERIGWVVLTIIVVASLLGLFSSGLLSGTSVASQDGAVAVDYERFARKTAITHFTIRIARVSSPEMHVRLDREFARFYGIEGLFPRPLRSAGGTAGLDMVFAPSAQGDLVVDLAARPKQFGFASIVLDVEGKLPIRQLIYP